MPGVRYKYQTIELAEQDYHLKTLRDTQQCPDDIHTATTFGVSSATWPLAGVLWQAEELLSRLMVTQPIKNLRILEVGCGTALASLVLKRRGADITATDHNPEAGVFLSTNTELNDLPPIHCECMNWHDITPGFGRFDLIIGSDLLYDRHNLDPLVRFIQQHAADTSTLIFVDPKRGLTRRFSRALEDIGYSVTSEATEHAQQHAPPADFLVLRCERSPLPVDRS
ncbi:MAG: methyltransferase [bacterium]